MPSCTSLIGREPSVLPWYMAGEAGTCREGGTARARLAGSKATSCRSERTCPCGQRRHSLRVGCVLLALV